MNKINVEIGKRIYERRKQLGITQEALSELTETTPQAISNYERGEREIKASTIIKISEVLCTTTDYILTGKNNSFNVPDSLKELNDADKNIIYEIVEKCINLVK